MGRFFVYGCTSTVLKSLWCHCWRKYHKVIVRKASCC